MPFSLIMFVSEVVGLLFVEVPCSKSFYLQPWQCCRIQLFIKSFDMDIEEVYSTWFVQMHVYRGLTWDSCVNQSPRPLKVVLRHFMYWGNCPGTDDGIIWSNLPTHFLRNGLVDSCRNSSLPKIFKHQQIEQLKQFPNPKVGSHAEQL